MNWSVGIATGSCPARPVLDVLSALASTGITGVELGTPPRHFNPGQTEQVVAVANYFQRSTLRPISIHAPFGGPLELSDPNEHHRHAAIGGVLAAARALKRLGGRLVVVHPTDIVRHGSDVDSRLHACAGSLRVLSERCREEDMTLAIESPLPHLIGGHPDEFAWVLHRVDATAGVCLDTGHTALGGHWHRFVEVAGARLVHVHASDNHGQRDDHLPPGEGRLEWSGIARSLRDAGFTGWVMLELQCPDADLRTYFQRAHSRATVLLGE